MYSIDIPPLIVCVFWFLNVEFNVENFVIVPTNSVLGLVGTSAQNLIISHISVENFHLCTVTQKCRIHSCLFIGYIRLLALTSHVLLDKIFSHKSCQRLFHISRVAIKTENKISWDFPTLNNKGIISYHGMLWTQQTFPNSTDCLPATSLLSRTCRPSSN